MYSFSTNLGASKGAYSGKLRYEGPRETYLKTQEPTRSTLEPMETIETSIHTFSRATKDQSFSAEGSVAEGSFSNTVSLVTDSESPPIGSPFQTLYPASYLSSSFPPTVSSSSPTQRSKASDTKIPNPNKDKVILGSVIGTICGLIVCTVLLACVLNYKRWRHARQKRLNFSYSENPDSKPSKLYTPEDSVESAKPPVDFVESPFDSNELLRINQPMSTPSIPPKSDKRKLDRFFQFKSRPEIMPTRPAPPPPVTHLTSPSLAMPSQERVALPRPKSSSRSPDQNLNRYAVYLPHVRDSIQDELFLPVHDTDLQAVSSQSVPEHSQIPETMISSNHSLFLKHPSLNRCDPAGEQDLLGTNSGANEVHLKKERDGIIDYPQQIDIGPGDKTEFDDNHTFLHGQLYYDHETAVSTSSSVYSSHAESMRAPARFQGRSFRSSDDCLGKSRIADTVDRHDISKIISWQSALISHGKKLKLSIGEPIDSEPLDPSTDTITADSLPYVSNEGDGSRDITDFISNIGTELVSKEQYSAQGIESEHQGNPKKKEEMTSIVFPGGENDHPDLGFDNDNSLHKSDSNITKPESVLNASVFQDSVRTEQICECDVDLEKYSETTAPQLADHSSKPPNEYRDYLVFMREFD